ncbi:MAG TPA: glycoside hydrolase family 3 protein [Rhizobiales bacterium]|nr:glycoside hydrolase family 3 protein [Hyphomicrobiales bacterium]
MVDNINQGGNKWSQKKSNLNSKRGAKRPIQTQPKTVLPQNSAPKDFAKTFDIIKKNEPKNIPVKITGKSSLNIGQMIMVGFRGTSQKNAGVRAVMKELAEGSIGGVMLMKHNVVSIAQIRRLTTALRRAARSGGQPPPFISVDQEGGQVQRLRFTRFPSAARIARASARNAAATYGRMACELHSAGINVNFGPVVDLNVFGKSNPIIGRLGRSYSKNPDVVVKYASQFVAAHKKYGIMTAAKHFPGHGSSLKDSHKGFTAIPRWNQTELIPFRKLAVKEAGQAVDLVMVGHLYNKIWGAPASLSHKAITGILRNKVGFRGLAITDDMEMGAIRRNYKWSQAIRMAVNAGNDILLYSNTAGYDPYLGRKIRNVIARSICSPGQNNQPGCIPARVIKVASQRIYFAKTDGLRRKKFNQKRRCSRVAKQ